MSCSMICFHISCRLIFTLEFLISAIKQYYNQFQLLNATRDCEQGKQVLKFIVLKL